MTKPQGSALTISHRLLRVLIALNFGFGILILALLVASLVDPEWVMRGLGIPATGSGGPMILGMRLIMVIGILGVPITNMALARLLAIVATVRLGDPFVPENARHLHQIAWAVLGLELLHICVGIVVASVAPLHLHWSFSPTPWLAVLLLFVLASVFDHGTQMRETLEGTV